MMHETIKFPISFKNVLISTDSCRTTNVLSGSDSNFAIKSLTNVDITSSMYDNGRGYDGFFIIVLGK